MGISLSKKFLGTKKKEKNNDFLFLKKYIFFKNEFSKNFLEAKNWTKLPIFCFLNFEFNEKCILIFKLNVL